MEDENLEDFTYQACVLSSQKFHSHHKVFSFFSD